MRAVDIIEKKKIGEELSEQEISFFMQEYNKGNIEEYQMAAFLMAVYFQSMTDKETYFLTKSFIDSGEKYNFDSIKSTLIDKHSTGGVGDKISIALSPLLASLGIASAKLSGRGLGFTGGTVDKLESIKGFTFLDTEKALTESINKVGFGLIQASPSIIPVEKKIYNLRDVTATINSYPLMVSSILSKKLALNTDLIVIDLKVGNGAFIKDIEQAKVLANKMKIVAEMFNRKIVCVLTSMDDVLGYTVGNRNEVVEAINTLNGKIKNNFSELLFDITKLICKNVFDNLTDSEIDLKISEVIKNGNALNKLKEFISHSGGENTILNESYLDENCKNTLNVFAENSGYISEVFVENIGLLSMKIGAGRETKSDIINYNAGVIVHKHLGDFVEKGEALLTIHTDINIPDSLNLNPENFYVLSEKEVVKPASIITII